MNSTTNTLDFCYYCAAPTSTIVDAFEEFPAIGLCIDCADDNVDGMLDPDEDEI